MLDQTIQESLLLFFNETFLGIRHALAHANNPLAAHDHHTHQLERDDLPISLVIERGFDGDADWRAKIALEIGTAHQWLFGCNPGLLMG
jgi:hypothetical protein